LLALLLALFWVILGPSSDVIDCGRIGNTGRYPLKFSKLGKPVSSAFNLGILARPSAELRKLLWTASLQAQSIV
jgi:hypothetical protein